MLAIIVTLLRTATDLEGLDTNSSIIYLELLLNYKILFVICFTILLINIKSTRPFL